MTALGTGAPLGHQTNTLPVVPYVSLYRSQTLLVALGGGVLVAMCGDRSAMWP